jgi:hypothetical protein
MYTHFYFVDIFPTYKARSNWLQLPLATLHINRHRVTSKIRLTIPRVKMSRADCNHWLAKMTESGLKRLWVLMIKCLNNNSKKYNKSIIFSNIFSLFYINLYFHLDFKICCIHIYSKTVTRYFFLFIYFFFKYSDICH